MADGRWRVMGTQIRFSEADTQIRFSEADERLALAHFLKLKGQAPCSVSTLPKFGARSVARRPSRC